MRSIRDMAQCGLVVLLLALPAAARTATAQEGPVWTENLAEAMRQAREQQKLVLVHFWTESCEPCRRLERYVFPHPQVAAAMAANYVPVKINARENRDLVERFGVRGWPTDIVITPDGEEVFRRVSPGDSGSYVAMLDGIAKENRPRSDQQNGSLRNDYATRPGPSPSNVAGGRWAGTAERWERADSGAPSQHPFENQQASSGRPASRWYRDDADPGSGYRGSEAQPAQYTTDSVTDSADWRRGEVTGSSPNNRSDASGDQRMASQGQGYSAAQGPGYIENPYNVDPRTVPPRNAVMPPRNDVAQAPDPRYGGAVSNQYLEREPADARDPRSASRTNQPIENEWYTNRSGAAPPTGASRPSGDARTAQGYDGRSWQGDAAPRNEVQRGTNNELAERSDQAPTDWNRSPSHTSPQTPPDWRAGLARDERATQPRGDAPEQPAGAPPLGLDGFCPVTLAEQSSWTSGDARYGAIHRGRLYLFVGPEEQKRFLANPDYFSPVLSGFDAVRFAEGGELVSGNRAHGLFFKNQVFLFADEEALERFCKSPESFAATAYEAMRQSGPNRQLR